MTSCLTPFLHFPHNMRTCGLTLYLSACKCLVPQHGTESYARSYARQINKKSPIEPAFNHQPTPPSLLGLHGRPRHVKILST